jgi:spermidine synthase
MFVSATLLFVVQPMIGKMILPLLGGTPAVWSTCMVFFQAALLGGYAYAHASTAWLGARRQALLHLAVLALPFATLPLVVNPNLVRGGEANPVLDVLLLLSLSVGLPFLAVSATAPLLQTWFAHTGHPAAGDPYFLYAASNLGSLLALLAYPTLIEPRFALQSHGWRSQTELWTFGYLVLIGLTVLCALALWWRARAADPLGSDAAAPVPAREGMNGAVPSRGRRLRWVLLALAPSSLLLGVTTYITTDVAAIPLLWVLPLTLYLLSFVIAFGRWPVRLHRAVTALAIPLILVVIFPMVSGFRERIWIAMLWHLALLFVVSLSCHGELALDRPRPRYLTEFYLLISVGGVLGGLFNALLAPVLFSSLLEYPLAMALGAMLVSAGRGGRGRARDVPRDAALALGVGALALVLYSDTFTARVDVTFLTRALDPDWTKLSEWLGSLQRGANKILIYGPPLIAVFWLRRRPVALGLALIAVLLIEGFVDARNDNQIRQVRSFFGVLHVTRDREGTGYTSLRHGTTLHGQQSRDPARRGEPLSYYHRQGPIGQVFAELERRAGACRIAVIGLGAGTLAAYARPGDGFTFYEIDRAVRDLAFDPEYFTYLADARARAATLRVELGDARIRLGAVRRERPGERYDLIAVDAFTSDAIPVHLLTREAVRLYLDMLTPDGLVALHISNRYLDLMPVLANLAEDAGLGGRLIEDDDAPKEDGAASSTWVVLAPRAAALGGLARDSRWTAATLAPASRIGVWTDDFHNVLGVFKWR